MSLKDPPRPLAYAGIKKRIPGISFLKYSNCPIMMGGRKGVYAA